MAKAKAKKLPFVAEMEIHKIGPRSFVHDPKMAREPIVTANVKLQFVGQDGDRFVSKNRRLGWGCTRVLGANVVISDNYFWGF
jgi:hypothetical protein